MKLKVLVTASPYSVWLRCRWCRAVLFAVETAAAEDVVDLKAGKDQTESAQHRKILKNEVNSCCPRSLTWLPELGVLLVSSDGCPGFEMLMLLVEETKMGRRTNYDLI